MAPVLFGELGELVFAFVDVGDEAGLEDVPDEVEDVEDCDATEKVGGLVVSLGIVGDEVGLEDIAEDGDVVEEGGTIELISLVITEMPDVDVGLARKWSVTAEFPQPMSSQVSGPAVRRAVEQYISFGRAARAGPAQEGNQNIYLI